MNLLNKRLWLLIAAALATFFAINFAKRGDSEQNIAEVTARKDRPAKKSADGRNSNAATVSEKLQRDKMLVPQKLPNLFAAKDWAPPVVIPKAVKVVALPPAPPTPPPVPTKPPEPQAPEFGFAYLGKVQEAAGKPLIFLVKNDRIYEAAPGDVLEATFRIDSIERGKMVVTYLPLNKQQTISIGDS
jgi:hypothetical protein